MGCLLRGARLAAGTLARVRDRLRNRTRIAEVGTVYDATPTPRKPADILPATEEERGEAAAGPVSANKWLVASVVDDAASVVGRIVDEAQRRDPEHQRSRVALVDGNNHQIDRIGCRGPHAQRVGERRHRLHPRAGVLVEGGMVLPRRRRPHRRGVGAPPRLRGPRREAHPGGRGDPACRHDGRARPRQTGRRRCLRHLPDQQVPAPGLPDHAGPRLADRHRGHRRRLPPPGQGPDGPHRRPLGTERCGGHPYKLRALRSNSDFEDYWQYHLLQKRQRVHQSRYTGHVIPQAA